MPRVLALDISTHCGWAHDHPNLDHRPHFGVWHLPNDGKNYGPALVAFARKVRDKITTHNIEVLAIEETVDPTHIPKDRYNVITMRLLERLAGVAEFIGTSMGLKVYEVNNRVWRAQFADTAQGGKTPATHRCWDLGWQVAGDNDADACGIWAYHKSALEPDNSHRYTLLFREDADVAP